MRLLSLPEQKPTQLSKRTYMRKNEVQEKAWGLPRAVCLLSGASNQCLHTCSSACFVGPLDYYVNIEHYIYIKLVQSINIQVSAAIFMNMSTSHVALMAITFSVTRGISRDA